MTPSLSALEHRIERLERAASRWRLVAVSSLAGALFLAAAPSGEPAKDLVVTSLLVKSPSGPGFVRLLPGSLMVEGDGARVVVKTDGVAADGRASIEVSSDGQEAHVRSGRLALADTRRELLLEARADSLQMSIGKTDAALQLINREEGALVAVGPPGRSAKLRASGLEVAPSAAPAPKFPGPR